MALDNSQTDFFCHVQGINNLNYLSLFQYQAQNGSTTQTVNGLQSVGCHYHPNAFLMSILLFFGTFLIAYQLKKAKTSNFFPAAVKNFISDFAVIIANII